MTPRRRKAKVIDVDRVGPDHAVLTVLTKNDGDTGLTHRTRVCAECPWRLDAPIGAFPANAYRHSARTAYDMAPSTFACHMAGTDRATTCAGFILRNSAHNMAARIGAAAGRINFDAITDDVPLYANYRAMAEANGVPPDDPTLTRCRADDE